MCGIVGIISLKRLGFSGHDSEIFTDLLTVDALRGPDSTGVILVDREGNVKTTKVAAPPHRLTSRPAWRTLMSEAYQTGRVLIGHNRKATVGAVTNKNAHPFTNGSVSVVHNGFVSNHKDFGDFEVDSMAVAQVLSEKEPQEALSLLSGAFGLAWYNRKTNKAYLVRNHARPMALVVHDEVCYFASEAPMLSWILRRGRRDINTAVGELKEDTLLEFDLSERAIKSSKIEWAKVTATNTYGTMPTIYENYESWVDRNTPTAVIPDRPQTEVPSQPTQTATTSLTIPTYSGQVLLKPNTSVRAEVTALDTKGVDRYVHFKGIFPGVQPWAAKYKLREAENHGDWVVGEQWIGHIHYGVYSLGKYHYYLKDLRKAEHHFDESGNKVHKYNTVFNEDLTFINRRVMPAAEWVSKAQECKCRRCNGPLHVGESKITKLIKTGEDYKFVCPKCVKDEFMKLSARKQTRRRALYTVDPSTIITEVSGD